MMDIIDESEIKDHCKETLAIVYVVYQSVSLNELRILLSSCENLTNSDLEEMIRFCGFLLFFEEMSFISCINRLGITYCKTRTKLSLLTSPNVTKTYSQGHWRC